MHNIVRLFDPSLSVGVFQVDPAALTEPDMLENEHLHQIKLNHQSLTGATALLRILPDTTCDSDGAEVECTQTLQTSQCAL